MAKEIRGANVINGKFKVSLSSFTSRNPADWSEVIGYFPQSLQSDIDAAVSAAKDAYKTWRLVPAPKRAEILYRAAQILTERKEELVVLMTREMGKNLTESRGDIQEAIDMCKFIAGEGRRLHGETTTSELPNKAAFSIRIPIGVAALITPWNFPVAIPSWKVAPALICGNTVVLKPSEDTPACAEAFVRILLEAGLDEYPGVINLVHGNGETGAALVAHPDTRLVSFTGSSEVGRLIAAQCANLKKRTPIREMGGKNCTIVMDDANLNLAVASSWWGAYGTCGQRCTASSRMIVHERILHEFLAGLKKRALNTVVGNGLDPRVEVGPLINKAALEKVRNYMEIAKDEGAKIVCGGKRLTSADYAQGFFFEPTILWAPDPKMRVNQEEIFGPVTSIIPVKSFEQALEVANDVNYGLSTAIITNDVNRAFIAMRDLESRITYVNSSTIGAEVHLPFGGCKMTGDGHSEGGHAIDSYSDLKTCYIDYSGSLQKAQIDNN